MVAGLGRVVGAWRGLDAGRVGKPEIVGRVGKSCAMEGKGERGRGASRCGEGVDGVVTGWIAGMQGRLGSGNGWRWGWKG